MGIWSGWQDQLLTAAGLNTSGANEVFMGDWHQHASTDCRNNPVDISLDISGASPCALTSNTNHRARNYASHDQAAGQFAAQLHSGAYPHLLSALQSGDPYALQGSDKVASDLAKWGSAGFASRYTHEVNASSTHPAQALKGWHDLRRSVNKHMPAALRHSDRQMARALRALGRARKVKL